MVRFSKLYNYPAHAIRVFNRVVEEQRRAGRELTSLSKGYFLGTGVSLRFEFDDSVEPRAVRLTFEYGSSSGISESDTPGWRLATTLPMKAIWITVGHFYMWEAKQDSPA